MHLLNSAVTLETWLNWLGKQKINKHKNKSSRDKWKPSSKLYCIPSISYSFLTSLLGSSILKPWAMIRRLPISCLSITVSNKICTLRNSRICLRLCWSNLEMISSYWWIIPSWRICSRKISLSPWLLSPWSGILLLLTTLIPFCPLWSNLPNLKPQYSEKNPY